MVHCVVRRGRHRVGDGRCGERDRAAHERARSVSAITTDATASSGSMSGGASEWEKVVPGGDCMCADGSEFAFWERRADPTKVVLFLDGGGACFDAETCAFTGGPAGGEENYDWSIYGDDPATEGGIFDFARADNPFADYSFLYVPSCTGDAHLGDVTREYSPELTVEHNGFVNGTAALSYLAENYPDAAQVVVVGKSVGSVAAPVYGGLAADLLPDAQVTVFGGQSGHTPDDPAIAEILGQWGVYDNMPDWEVNEGLTAGEWDPRRFWIQAGLHARTSSWPASTSPTTPQRQRGPSRWVRTHRPSSPRSTPTRRRSRPPAWSCTATPRPAATTGSSSGTSSTRSRSTASRWSTGSTR